MQITKLYNEPATGTSGLTDNSNIVIDDPTDINGRTGYRRLYYLRFQFDSYANAIRIHTDTSKLQSEFEPTLLHLTSSNDTFQTQDWQVEEDDDLVKVHLTHPWRLNKVKTWDARGIDVLRLDGEALSEEPTIKANANNTIAAEFIGQDFALRKKSVYNSSEVTPAANAASNAMSKVADKAKGKTMKEKEIMAMSLESGSGPKVTIEDATMEGSFSDDIAAEAIPAHGIKWIQLKSYPTGPRITIGNINQVPDAQTQWQTLWSEPGEHRDSISQPLNATESVLQQLQTQLDRYFEQARKDGVPIPEELFVPVAIESDRPAKFRLHDLEIKYSLLKNHWDHWTDAQREAGKQTLQFDGTTLASQRLELVFPNGAQVKKALIHLGTDISETSGFAPGALSADLQQTTGIQAGQGTTVAKRLDLSQAKQVNQVALAVLPVTEQATLTIKLVEDQNGKPAGAVLAESATQIIQTNGRQWIVAILNNSVLLDAKIYWLTLSCMDNSVIWLGNATQGKASLEKDKQYRLVNTIALLGELGHTLPASENALTGNLSFKFDNTLQTIDGEELNATANFASLPANIDILSGEAGSVILYAPEIEYS